MILASPDRCKYCGLYKTEPGEVLVIEDLLVTLAKMFDVQPDVNTHRPAECEGNEIHDYALGLILPYQDKVTAETKIFERLIGTLREVFQRTFGETYTARRLWWRERPNILRYYVLESRATKYALWFALAIDGLTDAERDALSCVPEGASVLFEVITSDRK